MTFHLAKCKFIIYKSWVDAMIAPILLIKHTYITHHQASFSITRHHSTSPDIIHHHYTSFSITRHHSTSLDIIHQHYTSFTVTRHHSPSPGIITHHYTSFYISRHYSLSLDIIHHHQASLRVPNRFFGIRDLAFLKAGIRDFRGKERQYSGLELGTGRGI